MHLPSKAHNECTHCLALFRGGIHLWYHQISFRLHYRCRLAREARETTCSNDNPEKQMSTPNDVKLNCMDEAGLHKSFDLLHKSHKMPLEIL